MSKGRGSVHGVPGCRGSGVPGFRARELCLARRHIMSNERGKTERRMLIIQVSSPPSALFLNVLVREIPPATQATKAMGNRI